MKWFLTSIALTFSLVAIWTGPGKMLAHAEEGLPFYRPDRTFNIYKYIWQDSDLGLVNPFLISRLTLYQLSAWFNSYQISGIKVQQLVLFILILTPLIAVPPLTNALSPSSNKSVGITAALLYVFNLFVLSQVLRRFIYPLIFVWSYLPLFLYLWLKWLETRKMKYLFYFILSNFNFSDVYGLTSSVFALWVPAGVLWFRRRQIIPAVAAIFLWMVTTVWWWYPLFSIKDNPYNQSLNPSKNLTTLVDVSKYYPNSEVVFLKQKYYFGPESIWSKYFSSKPINYISTGLAGLIIIGILSTLKFKSGKLLILWLLIGWFLVKGANPPLGIQFYEWLFKTFPLTMVVRNPYEKLGVIFLLPYCLLAAIGLTRIPFRFVRTMIIFLICFVLLRPMWTGQVFAGYQVEIPPSYGLANAYLNSRSNLRLLQLPFLHGAGTQYVWGYAGEEPSNFLFDRPSLSGTYFSPTDPYMLIYKYLRSPKFYRLMQFFAIDTLVVHKDVLPGPAFQENYEGTKSMTSQMENVKLTRSFADLDIYQLDPEIPVKWGYLSNRIWSVHSLQAGLEMVVNDNSFLLASDSFTFSQPAPAINATSIPIYKVTKLSPTHYRFDIKQAKQPYALIIQTSFNKSWTAEINNEQITNHIQINGYANGWLVDKSGDYVINISFRTWPWE